MIKGYVSEDRVPYITINLAGTELPAIVDSGFNGDLDLPMILQLKLQIKPQGEITATLAGGLSIRQQLYQLDILFDGELQTVYATFSDTDEVLLGTRLMRNHRLDINFPVRTVRLERVE